VVAQFSLLNAHIRFISTASASLQVSNMATKSAQFAEQNGKKSLCKVLVGSDSCNNYTVLVHIKAFASINRTNPSCFGPRFISPTHPIASSSDLAGMLSMKERTPGGVGRGKNLVWPRNDAILGVGFLFKKIIFYFNKGILVTLHPKTTSFWIFHPLSRFHLTEGAKL
jgi:hypothetical protein